MTAITPDRGDLPEPPLDAAPPAERPPKFTLVPFDNLTVSSDAVYLVQGLVPRVGLTVAWGPPKCGKSFWAFDLGMHVALGRKYRGRRVQAGPVVYCAFEGAAGIKRRAEAFRRRFLSEKVQSVPFFLSSTPMDLAGDHRELIVSIGAHVLGQPPALVVLDTLNRSLRGSESDDRDMTAYIKAADAIRDAFHCAVVVIHHCGIDTTRPRGHTALAGAVDAQLAVIRDQADNIIVLVERMKDGPEGEALAFRLETVEVGQDVEGGLLTSCVVVPAELLVEPSLHARGGPAKLTDRQRRAMDALDETIITVGAPAPPGLELPDGVMAVETARWREEMLRRHVIDANGSNPRAAFQRICDQLGARRLIGQRDGLVWKASSD